MNLIQALANDIQELIDETSNAIAEELDDIIADGVLDEEEEDDLRKEYGDLFSDLNSLAATAQNFGSYTNYPGR